MKRFDYSAVREFLHDRDFIRLLYADVPFPDLLERLTGEDFLVMDRNLKVPFFAEVRDYTGAVEVNSPSDHWIVKPVEGEEALKAAMGSVCFFLDFLTHTISAPTIVTRIGGRLHKATKILSKAEQLTGANYTDIPQLKEQLLLDLINRWIFSDEDRNPNNYMIRYNSRNDQIVIAIDFSNVDLLYKGIKIKGHEDSFGWERMEKTRYLTPLKVEHFEGYDMRFFNMRFDGFAALERNFLLDLCKRCLRFETNHVTLSKTIASNLLQRIRYVHAYFQKMFPMEITSRDGGKYKEMGKTFGRIYGEEDKG